MVVVRLRTKRKEGRMGSLRLRPALPLSASVRPKVKGKKDRWRRRKEKERRNTKAPTDHACFKVDPESTLEATTVGGASERAGEG